MHVIASQLVIRRILSLLAGLALVGAGVVTAPANAVDNVTTYNVNLDCPATPSSADANLVVDRIQYAESNLPIGESAVINFLVPAGTDCVVDLAAGTVKYLVIDAERDITINGPSGEGESLTILADDASTTEPTVTFTSAYGHTLTMSNLAVKGVASATADDPLVVLSGSDANIELSNVTLADRKLGATATLAAALQVVATASSVAMSQVTVSGNESGEYGAVKIEGTSAVTVTNSTFAHNRAQKTGSQGGAIADPGDGTLAIEASTFTDNSSDANGGAVYSTAVPVSFVDTTFHGNASLNGSGGAVGTGAAVTSDACTFTGNTAYTDAGALLAGGTVTVTDSTFTDNEATHGNSGALLAANGGTVARSTFTTNTAKTDGGAIDAGAKDIDISDSEFTGNTATDGNAGAVYSSHTGSTVERSTFENNSAGTSAGALLVAGDVSTSTFVGNSAPDAGAVATSGLVTASTFQGNSTDIGGLVLKNEGSGFLFGSIIASASDVVASQETTDLADLGANLVTKLPGSWTSIADTHSAEVTLADLDLQDLALNVSGPDNEGMTRTVALGDSSVAIDYYTFTPTVPTAVEMTGDASLVRGTDQRGVDRPLNDAIDVGAYEHAAPPTCVTTTLGNIRFASDSSRLTAKAKAQLRVFAHQIDDAGCTYITLNGHTSGKGNSALLERIRTKLAKARNAAVKKYLKAELTKLDVTVTFHTHVYNANDPLVSNSGSKAYLNRRVQVTMGMPPTS